MNAGASNQHADGGGDRPMASGPVSELIRARDWGATPLGPREDWPAALRVALDICLNSRFPMFLWWGPELIHLHNDSFGRGLGEGHAATIGRPAREAWRGIWPQIEPMVKAVVERGESTYNERLRLAIERYGQLHEGYFTFSFSPILDDARRPLGLFCVVIDETRRVGIETDRNQLAQQRQLALDAAKMGWWHYDPVTKVANWDDRYKEIFGVTGSERPNEEILARLHPDDLPGVWAAVERALDPVAPKPYSVEYRIRLDDGAIRWVEAHGLATFEGEGPGRKAVSFVGTVADITGRRQAEEDLRQLNRTLEERVAERTAEARRRAAQLQGLAGELTRAESRERQRVAKVLHDHLQQLLVAATMRATLLKNEVSTEAGQGYLQVLQEALTQSIESARTLTVELSPPVLHSAGLPAGLAWLARWMGEKHHLEIHVQADDAADPETEDLRSFLFQSARELLFNVVKHARVARAHVRLTRTDDGQIELTVEDDGRGLDPTRAAEGQAGVGGFGLFSIRERADLLGGRLTITGAAGKGTRVSLRLPTHSPADLLGDPAAATTDKAAAPKALIAQYPTIRLVLADDHKIVRQGLASLLARQQGVTVVGEASDGIEAVELAGRLRPDVILMDINMPNMDGIEATRQITAAGLTGVHVIGLSMHQDAEVKARMRQAGAVAYLPKDSPAGELINTIRQSAAGIAPA
ncbi:MAG: response regulator [Planctomycetota bacterium]|nr:response regulator [Planctomycetota bacterium]